MKIKISPENLKPGQLFDARRKEDHDLGYFDYTFSSMPQGDFEFHVTTEEGEVIPVNNYEFFIEVRHPELVQRTAKSGEAILKELTPEKCALMHFGSCLAGEVGEIWDALKKHLFYGKEIDRTNLVEELGDLEWYLEGLRQTAGITREETLDGNIAKLSKRYADGYSNAAAQARVDKQEPNAFRSAVTTQLPRDFPRDTPDSDAD